jgi:hypothetical protein
LKILKGKLLEEIQLELDTRLPDYDNTKNMPYMKAVLDETLR